MKDYKYYTDNNLNCVFKVPNYPYGNSNILTDAFYEYGCRLSHELKYNTLGDSYVLKNPVIIIDEFNHDISVSDIKFKIRFNKMPKVYDQINRFQHGYSNGCYIDSFDYPIITTLIWKKN